MSGFLFNKLPIKKALNKAAMANKMTKTAAYSSLVAAMVATGMDTSAALAFVPQVAASATNASVLPTAGAITATAATVSAAAVSVAAVSSAPMFTDTEVLAKAGEYYKDEVKIETTVSAALNEIDEVYIVDENNNKIYAEKGEENSDRYAVSVDENGIYTLEATTKNNATASTDVTVECIDNTQPSIDSFNYDDEGARLNIAVSDDLSGVDFESVYAVSGSGEKILPETIDTSTGEIEFNMTHGAYMLYITDNAGTQGVYEINIAKK